MPKTLTATPYPFISVFNDDAENPTFALTVIDALNKIASSPAGNQLLQGISNSLVGVDPDGGFKVKIVRAEGATTIGRPGEEGGSRAVAFNEQNGRASGSRAACYWNPNIFVTPNGARPPFIGLAHELIHCYHYTNGLAKASYQDEEKFTVGLDNYAQDPITENRIREQHNVPVRTQY